MDVVVIVFLVCSWVEKWARVGNQGSQHTGEFVVVVTCRLSRAVEFIVSLGALRKIGEALTQSRAYARLRLDRNTDILFQRDGSPKRKGDKSV